MPVIISGTTGVSGVDGSASSPAIEGADTDTGIFFPSNGVIGFTNDGTERMRIAANGNVGIGTNSPLARLDVVSSDRKRIRATGASEEGMILFQNGTTGTGTSNGFLVGIGGDSNAYLLNYHNSSTIFHTNNTERMRIDSSGNLLIGTSATVSTGGQLQMQGYNAAGGTGYHGLFAFYNTYGTATNPYKFVRLNSAGGIEVINSAYNAVIFTMDNSGNFTAAANITAYSDIRLKANIHPIKDALAKVQQMQGVSYERKSDGEKKIGFIAQDLQKVLPEVVIENHDGLLSVDYGNIVALLTEAIKEQQVQIESLRDEIETLKAK